MTSILIADDEELVRKGIRLIIDGTPDLQVVAEASTGKEAIAQISTHQPDVVLMDIRMPIMSGIEALPHINSSIPVIVLTAFDTDEFVLAALRAGAVGFLLKSTAPSALVASVRAAAEGQQLLSPSVLAQLVKETEHIDPHPQTLPILSDRENEIAQLIAEGLDNSEIAARLFISVPTVKTHIRHILDKIDGTSRVHIAIAVLGSSKR